MNDESMRTALYILKYFFIPEDKASIKWRTTLLGEWKSVLQKFNPCTTSRVLICYVEPELWAKEKLR